MLHAGDLGAIRGDGDGVRAGPEVGEGIERLDGRVAGRAFARCDVDFGGAGLEEAVGRVGLVRRGVSNGGKGNIGCEGRREEEREEGQTQMRRGDRDL